MITDYHAKLYAHELLLRRPSGDTERLTTTLMGARVDLNPHQVDAALFAFRSPLSKGALLADEVGLGKTIEAGIVLAQKWAEGNRRLLVITPASLRTQWRQELQEKFALPAVIMDKQLFEQLHSSALRNPFHSPYVIIASYDFARKKADLLAQTEWDLVIMDEAHRLRNVHKKGATVAKDLKRALAHAPKLLLTATPLQNSLEELYGLVSFIDDHVFCDIKTYRAQFGKPDEAALADLKVRLAPLCQRTLRRQVTEYIRYTERRALTQDFTLSPDEASLYEQVSTFLQREDLWSLPPSNRTLIILVLRKLLASSSYAIAAALKTMQQRLEFVLHNYAAHKNGEKPSPAQLDALLNDYESCGLEEEAALYGTPGVTIPTREEEKALRTEIQTLYKMRLLAEDIRDNAKGTALLQALDRAFTMTREHGGAPKAIIFTESCKTQEYIYNLLSQHGYAKQMLLFNGSNNDARATAIYQRWKEQYAGTDRVTGSREVDVRSALVDAFRNEASIMIATEAASEGINLQFCSLVINYDLPWNPQRIEQRIGRCHRYGQKHDVVVVNFLNRSNAADRRVFELLSEKFQLFSGIFGASDEVLGSIESGMDFEKRIAEIYQTCRSPEEIQASFDALQASLAEHIDASMHNTRQKLLENFDAEVAEKLHVYKVETRASLDRSGALFWQLTKRQLRDRASFDDASLSFNLTKSPVREALQGPYALPQSPCAEKSHAYRLHEPLARWVTDSAMNTALPPVTLHFDLAASGKNITALTPLTGGKGLLRVCKVTVKALEAEEHLLLCAVTEDGRTLEPETARKLFDLPAHVVEGTAFPDAESLQHWQTEQKQRLLEEITARNALHFEQEMDKLDRWADERKTLLEMQIGEMDRAIREAKAAARKAGSLEAKVDSQRHIKVLEARRNDMRKRLFEAQDKIEENKDQLLNGIEAALHQRVQEEELFCVGWVLG